MASVFVVLWVVQVLSKPSTLDEQLHVMSRIQIGTILVAIQCPHHIGTLDKMQRHRLQRVVKSVVSLEQPGFTPWGECAVGKRAGIGGSYRVDKSNEPASTPHMREILVIDFSAPHYDTLAINSDACGAWLEYEIKRLACTIELEHGNARRVNLPLE